MTSGARDQSAHVPGRRPERGAGPVRAALRVSLVVGALAGAAASATVVSGDQASGQAPGDAGLFSYDASQPLDVQVASQEVFGDVQVSDVSYARPGGARVTAWLVAPRASGRHAGLLFGHWGGGDRTEFLPEAILYAKAGVVSLLPSYPWSRPAPWRTDLRYSADPEHDLPVYVQTVVELRRGLDLLVARPDVDAARVGYVGHSYGAQWGAILAAVDRRPKALVLMGGVPDLDAIYRESDDPGYVELRSSDSKRVARLLEVMAPLAPIRYIGRAAPAPLLFQGARYEQNFPRTATERYFAAASEPKTLLWYPTAHDLNDPQALADRAAWLRRHLGFGPVTLPQAPLPKPDFSGEWTINLEKSRFELQQLAALTEATVRIDHHEPEFTLHRRFVVGGKESTLSVSVRTDGKETETRDGERTLLGAGTWDGDVLVFTTRIEAPQGVATNTVRYRLLEGGRVLEADEVFKAPRLSYHNVWVFERERN